MKKDIALTRATKLSQTNEDVKKLIVALKDSKEEISQPLRIDLFIQEVLHGYGEYNYQPALKQKEFFKRMLDEIAKEFEQNADFVKALYFRAKLNYFNEYQIKQILELPNAKDIALFDAVRRCDKKSVGELVQQKADVNQETTEGNLLHTLVAALMHQHKDGGFLEMCEDAYEIFKILNSAKPALVDDQAEQSYLDTAEETLRKYYKVELSALLMEKPQLFDFLQALKSQFSTQLWHAVKDKNMEAVTFFLKSSGVNKSEAVQVAVKSFQVDMLKTLLTKDAGVTLGKRSDKGNIMHELMRVMAIDPEAKDSQDKISKGVAIFKILYQLHPNLVHGLDREDRTPLALAFQADTHLEILHLILGSSSFYPTVAVPAPKAEESKSTAKTQLVNPDAGDSKSTVRTSLASSSAKVMEATNNPAERKRLPLVAVLLTKKLTQNQTPIGCVLYVETICLLLLHSRRRPQHKRLERTDEEAVIKHLGEALSFIEKNRLDKAHFFDCLNMDVCELITELSKTTHFDDNAKALAQKISEQVAEGSFTLSPGTQVSVDMSTINYAMAMVSWGERAAKSYLEGILENKKIDLPGISAAITKDVCDLIRKLCQRAGLKFADKSYSGDYQALTSLVRSEHASIESQMERSKFDAMLVDCQFKIFVNSRTFGWDLCKEIEKVFKQPVSITDRSARIFRHNLVTTFLEQLQFFAAGVDRDLIVKRFGQCFQKIIENVLPLGRAYTVIIPTVFAIVPKDNREIGGEMAAILTAMWKQPAADEAERRSLTKLMLPYAQMMKRTVAGVEKALVDEENNRREKAFEWKSGMIRRPAARYRSLAKVYVNSLEKVLLALPQDEKSDQSLSSPLKNLWDACKRKSNVADYPEACAHAAVVINGLLNSRPEERMYLAISGCVGAMNEKDEKAQAISGRDAALNEKDEKARAIFLPLFCDLLFTRRPIQKEEDIMAAIYSDLPTIMNTFNSSIDSFGELLGAAGRSKLNNDIETAVRGAVQANSHRSASTVAAGYAPRRK